MNTLHKETWSSRRSMVHPLAMREELPVHALFRILEPIKARPIGLIRTLETNSPATFLSGLWDPIPKRKTSPRAVLQNTVLSQANQFRPAA